MKISQSTAVDDSYDLRVGKSIPEAVEILSFASTLEKILPSFLRSEMARHCFMLEELDLLE